MSLLERLFEVDGLPSADLPEELERLYGGLLGLDEPRLVANFVSTLDGVVAIPSIPESNNVIAAGSKADHLDGTAARARRRRAHRLGGSAGSPQGTWLPEKVYPPASRCLAELRKTPRAARERPEVAVLSGRGSIDPAHPLLASGAVVLTSERGRTRLAGRIPRRPRSSRSATTSSSRRRCRERSASAGTG